MQVCLPVFKSELIWRPVGPRRAVGLPREMRRRHGSGTASLAATRQRQRHTNVCTARSQNPTAKARGRWWGGGGGCKSLARPGPKAPPPRHPGMRRPSCLGNRSACGWKALATPASGWAPCHPGVARVKVQVPSHCSRPAGRLWRVGDPKT